MSSKQRVGEVTHYFNHLNVAVIRVEQCLKVGDVVHFLGAHTDFGQTIVSMQMEHHAVSQAEPGQEVAIKVHQRVRGHDTLFRVAQATTAERDEELADMAS